MSISRREFLKYAAILGLTPLLDLEKYLPSAQIQNPEFQNTERIAPIHRLAELDPDNDGLLSPEHQQTVRCGDIIFRERDGTTAIREGQFIVPNNLFFYDANGDGILDQEPQYARVVVVMHDNLTYLFAPNSQHLLGVFPNGIGKAGANTVASIRRINILLGASWGAEYSRTHGYDRNMFGSLTFGTSYLNNENPISDVDSFQELHGTPPELEFLLGREISGGCTRHANQSVEIMRNYIGVGDNILTVYTAQDDQIDNPLNIYNRTRLASGLPPVEVPFTLQDLGLLPLTRPSNFMAPEYNLRSETPFWLNVDQVPIDTQILCTEHPFTRANYRRIPCGPENFLITELQNGRSPIFESNGNYTLNCVPVIWTPNGQLNISDFYDRPSVSINDLQPHLDVFSSGNNTVKAFEYLIWDYALKYARYVANRDFGRGDNQGLSYLEGRRLKEIQLVTGIIPVPFTRTGSDIVLGDVLAGSTNRTLEHSLMNIFYGRQGEVFELNFRNPISTQATPVTDLVYHAPSLDHELVRSGEDRDLFVLIQDAITNRKSAIFRISNYRYQTEPISYESDLPAAHYFALIPSLTNLSEGRVAIYDTMHPYKVLIAPIDTLASLFTSLTISPASQII